MAIQNTYKDSDKKAVVKIVKGTITEVCPDPIKMGTKPNQEIEWSIDSTDPNADYTFPDNGIEFKLGSGPDPLGQFTKIGPIGNGKKFRIQDKNSDKQLYPYTVNIMNGTTPLTPLDPMITNGE